MEMISPDYLDTDAPPGTPRGPEGWMQTHRMFFDAFPDLRITIEDMVAEGDKVLTRWTLRATHTGEFRGIPATGKRITITGMGIFCFDDGKVMESWDSFDRLGMMRQLGAIPAPERAGA